MRLWRTPKFYTTFDIGDHLSCPQLDVRTQRILELPDVKDKLFEIGAVASPMTPEDFAKFIEGERAKWADVVKAAGVKMD